MKGYILDYINENEFKKLERALKKYNMLAFKKLMFTYYPSLREGTFLGEMISHNKSNETETYELKLPSDKIFAKIHGDVKLIYTVHKKDSRVVLENITPSDILIEGHRSELTTYKGIMISKKNASKEMFKIDLLSKMRDKMNIIILVLTLLILVSGGTYAYFAFQGGDAFIKDVSVQSSTTDSLIFEIGDPIEIKANQSNFSENAGNRSSSTMARATLKANNYTNDVTVNYNLSLNILKNEFKYTTSANTAELILTIVDKNKNPITTINGLNYVTVGEVSGFDITEKSGLINILSNHELVSHNTEIEEWNVTLTFVNLGTDQQANAGKIFAAELTIQK